MSDIIDFLKGVSLIIITLILILFLFAFCLYKYSVEIGEANLIKIMVAGDIVYEGKSAFVSINSGGMTTTVKIYKKLFPFYVLDKVYSNRDVEVLNEDKK